MRTEGNCRRLVREGVYSVHEVIEIMFGPERQKHGRSIWNWDRAKEICEGCPAKGECLARARKAETQVTDVYGHFRTVVGDIFGMFGGMTPGERRKMYYEERGT